MYSIELERNLEGVVTGVHIGTRFVPNLRKHGAAISAHANMPTLTPLGGPSEGPPYICRYDGVVIASMVSGVPHDAERD